ncbi:MAG: M81 family metallopeptidase [Betaproteobacteria bacterium]|nr:M81 family metallopeptidase [Betaproteobacteria bacterium]
MRLLLAMMKHETNTFSPVKTDLARFARSGGGAAMPLRGAQAIAAYRGTGTVTGAFIDIAEREAAEIEMAIAADAWPSGPVEDDAYEAISDAILAAVNKGGYDAILLDLHGAMVTRTHEDGEGTLLARIRAIDAKTPIAVGYDMHANVYDEMIANADTVAGYQTYPHVDMYETGRRAGDALMRMLKGEARPTSAWGNVPMLPHVMRQGSDDEPNRSLQARAREIEKQGALCASVFVGFPHADIRNAGLSVVVVTDNDQAQAELFRDELLKQAWDARERFVYRIENLEQSVARAKAMTEGPVILLDHYDNAASGGTMDTTRVLAELLRQGLENVAAFAIFDPQAVEQAIAAGIGAQATLSIGGKLRMPMLPVESPSLEVSGRVKTIFDGKYRAKGPMSRGVHQDMGRAVVLDTGRVEIALISRHVEPFDVNALLSLGIDPMQKRYVMLKSRIHWRAGMGHLAKAVVECAGVGVCTSDYSQHTFRSVRRPIFPLD